MQISEDLTIEGYIDRVLDLGLHVDVGVASCVQTMFLDYTPRGQLLRF